MGMIFVFFIVSLICFILLVLFYNKNINTLKNIRINIVLLILSGIIYVFYQIFKYNNAYDFRSVIFIGISIILIVLFFNFFGYLFSIGNINNIYLSIICHSLFIISTILTFMLIAYIVDTLENKEIISECSIIIYFGIIMGVENIFSYFIAKIIGKISNRIRGKCT